MMRSNLATFAIASLLSVTTVGSLAACGSPPEGAASPAAAASPSSVAASAAAPGGAVKAVGDAKVGDTTKCPVSGEEFTVEASSPKTELEGKTYYFCCGGCKKKFEADPAKYLKKS